MSARGEFSSRFGFLMAASGSAIGLGNDQRPTAFQRICQRLQLRVNKANATAIRAYQRFGFAIIEDICTDIGSGFVMDDYRMELALG